VTILTKQNKKQGHMGNYNKKESKPMQRYFMAVIGTFVLLGSSVTIAETIENGIITDWYFKNGISCINCKLIRKKESMNHNVEKMTFEKPDKTVFTGYSKDLVKNVRPDELLEYNLDLETKDGTKYKNLARKLVDYKADYVLFLNKDGEKYPIPAREMKYIFNSDTGALLYDGQKVYETMVSKYQKQQQRQQNALAALGILNGMASSMQSNTESSYQPYQYQMLPTNKSIDCTTTRMGVISNTNCRGW
jgi:hypothetical protein